MPRVLHKIREEDKKKQLIVFDLDGTLTESKKDMSPETAKLFIELLRIKKVAVIGGGKYELFQRQIISKLHAPKELLERLFLFPTTSTIFYRYLNGSWKQIYALKLSVEEKKKIRNAFKEVFKELHYEHPKKLYGSVIEDRITQITFSAVGQEVPLAVKTQWKKEHTPLKLKLAKALQKKLPSFEVRAAGYTSIDVTRKGIDKSFGLKQIKKELGIQFKDMLFIGDALFLGGNDYAAVRTGVTCIVVDGPEDTNKLIKFLVK